MVIVTIKMQLSESFRVEECMNVSGSKKDPKTK